ncbi:MAG: L-lactate permease [Trueperaceae bacterium]
MGAGGPTAAVLAGLPLLVVLVAMLGLRWSAARAGAAGLALGLLIAVLAFGFGVQRLPQLGALAATGGVLLEAVFIAATILWIVFPALCIHELQLRTGAVDVLRDAMARLSGDPRILALLVAWFFVLFVEGAAGFGTSVALAAPFLVAAGFGRVEAVTVALIGHAAGVSFGAVGTPVLAQVAVTEFTGRELSAATVAYHSLAGALLPLVVMLLVTRTLPRERRTGWGAWGWTLLAAVSFLLPHHLLATYIGPELPTLAGSLLGGLAFVGVLRVAGGRDRARHERERAPDEASSPAPAEEFPARPPAAPALLTAGAPYLVLVAAVLATRLVPPLREALTEAAWAWQQGPFGGSFAPLYHPGSLLLLAFVVGATWQRAPRREALHAARDAALRLVPVTLALVAMLSLSRLMLHAGMIEALADAAAAGAGPAWPYFAPFVGLLGTFVTGSATTSNILFTDFQLVAARGLGLSPTAMLGAQGFGAAVGNIVCPHNLIAAGATVGLVGREGEVLRRTLWVALAYASLGGLLAGLFFA